MSKERAYKSKLKRFLSNATERQEAYIEAAKLYPNLLSSEQKQWLYQKPYTVEYGHTELIQHMNNALGLLKAMKLPPKTRILEVGCGPGWLTEILALTGYRVVAFDPSIDLLEIAQNRLQSASEHYRSPEILKNVTFLQASLEDINLEPNSFDGIIFYDILHHIIDEQLGISKCATLLKPGGKIGVIEGSWVPGNDQLETALEKEMKQFGTLENPYTQEYLDELLTSEGFVEITRLIGIIGFVASSEQQKSIIDVTTQPPYYRNDLVATKYPVHIYSSDPEANTQVCLSINRTQFNDSAVTLFLTVTNRGDSILIHGNDDQTGAVYFSLQSEKLFNEHKLNSLNWAPLPKNLAPGETLKFEADFQLPISQNIEWRLDIVISNVCWLSSRGFSTVPVIKT